MAEGSTAVAVMTVVVMAIHITTIKLVACPADQRRLNLEACCRRVTVEEGGSEAQCREAGVEAEAEVTQGGRRRGRLW